MSTKTGKKENLKSTIGQTLKNALNLPENFEVKRFEVASCSVFSGLEITMRGYLPDDSEEVVSQEKPAVSRVDKKKNDVKPEKKNGYGGNCFGDRKRYESKPRTWWVPA
jgi:hypothetical protein